MFWKSTKYGKRVSPFFRCRKWVIFYVTCLVSWGWSKTGGGVGYSAGYGPGTSLTDCAGATATEIDCAESGHRIIVRCRIVIICKRVGAELMHVEGVGPASG